MQNAQTPLNQSFKTFPQNGFCVCHRGSERLLRMVLLCAECLWTAAELMDTTQERAWNQFNASKKVPVDVNKALEQTNAFPRGALTNTEKCAGLQNQPKAGGPLVQSMRTQSAQCARIP